MMGLEEHLIGMFRDDFEFNESAGASHLGGHAPLGDCAESVAEKTKTATDGAPISVPGATSVSASQPTAGVPQWAKEAEAELGKIPFFVRKKARANTERFATDRGIALITKETLYEAKAHYAR